MNTELIRLKKISEMTSLSTATLRKMIKSKELKGVLIGNNYYVTPNDYADFLLYIECKKRGYTLEQIPKIKNILSKYQEKEEMEKINNMLKIINGQKIKDDNSNDRIEDEKWYQEYLKACNSLFNGK